MKDYKDLSEQEKSELSEAWLTIYEGLEVYERVTGAYNLDDIVYDDLWETIGYQVEAEQGATI